MYILTNYHYFYFKIVLLPVFEIGKKRITKNCGILANFVGNLFNRWMMSLMTFGIFYMCTVSFFNFHWTYLIKPVIDKNYMIDWR